MRALSPPEFDIIRFFEGIYIFQQWEIFPGVSTDGVKNVAQTMDALKIPQDLTGQRVLDIAPWNGFFSFECVRRGAEEVISLGPDDPVRTGYEKTMNLLEINNCKYYRQSVYDLSPNVHGTFDIVLFLGVIYHLRYPLLALDKIYDVSNKSLYIDSAIIDEIVRDTTIPPELSEKILSEGRVFHRLPIVYFTKGEETGDFYNWFIPNIRCLQDFVESAGFKIERSSDSGQWAWLSAVKGERKFTFGIEGFNSSI
jgi:tRNA (mo5U34)-methyltransferase